MKWLFCALPFLAFPLSIKANVVINEFLPNPSAGNNEWVELFNTGTDQVDVSTYKLVDDGNHSKDLTTLGTISPSGFAVYEYTGDGWLNNSGDSVHLKDSNGAALDDYTYTGNTSENTSYGRYPDGTGSFSIQASSTKGTTNSGPVPTPTQTLTPEPTTVPTNTPSPSNTPTSAPLPTVTTAPTPKPTPKPSPKPSLIPTPTNQSDPTPQVLGTTVAPTDTPAPQPIPTKKPFPYLGLILIGLGCLGIAVSVMLAKHGKA